MIIRYRHVGIILSALALTACSITEPRSITPGVAEAGKLRVTLDEGWFRVPGSEAPEKRSSTRALTREGGDKDRLYLVGGINDGQTIFKEEYASGAAQFDAGMPLTDIAGLAAGSVNAAIWRGAANIETVESEERGFTGIPGVQFELEVSGPANHRGMAGAFVVEERLYAVIFVAESPDAFERHQEAVAEIIDSAILSIKTIHR